MKRWLDRILQREDWIAQAVRHGLDAFGREPVRPEPTQPTATPRCAEVERATPQVEVSSSIP